MKRDPVRCRGQSSPKEERKIIMRNILRALALAMLAVSAVACSPDASARPAPATNHPVAGDDNRDGRVDEDESGWSWATMGNRARGNGKAPSKADAVKACTEKRRGYTTVPAKHMAACVSLGQRPPRKVANGDGSYYTDPAGTVLVRECRSQGLTVVELGYCLRQP